MNFREQALEADGAEAIHDFLVMVIESTANPNVPEEEQITKEGLDLWWDSFVLLSSSIEKRRDSRLNTIRAAKTATPGLLSIYPNLVGILQTDLDHTVIGSPSFQLNERAFYILMDRNGNHGGLHFAWWRFVHPGLFAALSQR